MNSFLVEVKDVLNEAMELVGFEEVNRENMYKLAPHLYSKRHTINSDYLLITMNQEIDEQVKMDWNIDSQSKRQFKFHFVSAYLLCFRVAGKINETEYNQLMYFINDEINLFEE